MYKPIPPNIVILQPAVPLRMRSHPDVLEEERAEILPSAADLAYKAQIWRSVGVGVCVFPTFGVDFLGGCSATKMV